MLLQLLSVDIDQYYMIVDINITNFNILYQCAEIILGLVENAWLPRELGNMIWITCCNVYGIHSYSNAHIFKNYVNLEYVLINNIRYCREKLTI